MVDEPGLFKRCQCFFEVLSYSVFGQLCCSRDICTSESCYPGQKFFLLKKILFLENRSSKLSMFIGKSITENNSHNQLTKSYEMAIPFC